MTNPPPLRVELGERSYDIRFYSDNPEAVAADIKPFVPERAFVVTNDTIWSRHGERFGAALTKAGIAHEVATVPDGERYKSLESASNLYDRLIRGRHSRRTCLIAFGGGVIGDLAGFVAATFLRGVDFIQVPTTVVAMVDSAVGGKTGVDHPLGKNLIGAFHQPRLVAVDTAYLRTLDEHNLRGGFAEVIKYGVIQDALFFEFLEREIGAALQLESAPLLKAIRTSCAVKAGVVAADEREGGLRAILNYGHTFAHAIESAAQYAETQMHGQAVAMGMVCAADLAVDLGLFDRESARRIEALIESAGLPTRVPAELAPEQLLDRMGSDKKVQAGKVRFVLPRRIGHVELVSDVPGEAVIKVLKARQKP